jgi:membrane protein YdbS with pleckstrin-like domain
MPQPAALVPQTQRPSWHRPRPAPQLTTERRPQLIVSISAVLLLAVFVYLLWRYANLSAWQAAVCVLLGYYLATSSLGPYLGHWLRSLIHAIAGLRL